MTTMNKPIDHMFRAGQISARALKRIGTIPGKPQKTKMADFNDKGGKRDQGGVRDRGLIGAREINAGRHQKIGSPALAGGLPSRGARAMPGKPTMDGGKTWPAGARASGQNRDGAPRRLSAQTGRIPPQGGQYGGGGQDTQ